MKVTFPHMGNLYIGARALLSRLGLDVVVPPRPSKRTLEIGTRYSPEFACLPLKVNIGNFVEAFELGADTILMAGGVGPCRFGYYGEVQRRILADMGYEFDMLIIEPPQGRWAEVIGKVKRLVGGASLWDVIDAVRFAWAKIQAVDLLEREANEVRAREAVRGSTSKELDRILEALDAAGDLDAVNTVKEEGLGSLRSIPIDPGREPLRVAIVGEIYVVLEPFVNLDVERVLGEMGVLVERSIYLGDWIREHVVTDILHPWRKKQQKVKELARPYLCHFVGGHGLESVGHTVGYARAGFDGVIQVAPFTCMPEIVAQSILSKVGKDMGIPVMTLIFDEHSADVGIVTRLEAFVDLVQRRRERQVRHA